MSTRLLFERFLNPERMSMPDIDIDFCFERRRDEVIRYVREKYGEDRVAQIITFGTLQGEAAIKDVGRVLEFPFGETDQIAKLYPGAQAGQGFRLHRRRCEMEPKPAASIARHRATREGPAHPRPASSKACRHASKHAAGIVISPQPLIEDLPALDGQGRQRHDAVQRPTTSTMIGLIKLRLPRPQDADAGAQRRAPHRRASRGTASTCLDELPLDDTPTYVLVANGRHRRGLPDASRAACAGCSRNCSRRRSRTSLAASRSTGRARSTRGMVDEFIERKHGARRSRSTRTPRLEPILEPDLRRHRLPGAGDADRPGARRLHASATPTISRRAMGKKKAEEMKERERFIAGAAEARRAGRAKRRSRSSIRWRRSRSTASKSLGGLRDESWFQTAYLQAHFRLKSSWPGCSLEMGDTDKTFKNHRRVPRARHPHPRYRDMNESREDFPTVRAHADEGGLRPICFGLCAVRGVGGKAVDAILGARRQGRPAHSSLAKLPKHVLVALLRTRTATRARGGRP